MAQILEFGVSRYADMVEEVLHTIGPREVDRRTEHLPKQFIDDLKKELRRRSDERYARS